MTSTTSPAPTILNIRTASHFRFASTDARSAQVSISSSSDAGLTNAVTRSDDGYFAPRTLVDFLD